MPRLSVDSAISRITADSVISRRELADVAELAEARSNPQALADKLTPIAGQMTGRASDAFKRFCAGLTAGNGAAALGTLAKESLDTTAPPSWLPAAFDFTKASAGALEMLTAQGEPAATIGAGKADKVIFTDVDLTLLKTDTPTLLKHKVTGAWLRDPGTGKLVLFHELKKELDALKAKYPTFNFDEYAPDFREFGSVAELLRTSVIPEDVRLLRRSDADAKSRDFIITARSDEIMIDALDLLLTQKGIDINGVFAVNGPTAVNKVGMTPPADPSAAPGTPPAWKLSSSQRKAVTMAAILMNYGGQDHVKHVKFLDDGDDNLQAAMDLLPKLFPKIKFEFLDVEHVGNKKFKQRLVAYTGEKGELFAKDGKPFSTDAIRAYTDNDVPMPLDPRLYPHLVLGPGH